ncbi:MAG: hypothetical protein CM1200mP34_3150 [Verrucomicrobiales bacterium]|nr:MAG: hypothetical protein CM1200mP34_3150 [Verrucomicrobiales bacterium]
MHRPGEHCRCLDRDVVIGGTPTEGVDYTLASKSITLPAGAESALMAVRRSMTNGGKPGRKLSSPSLKLNENAYEINHEYRPPRFWPMTATRPRSPSRPPTPRRTSGTREI